MFAWLSFSAFTSGGRYKTFRTLKGHLKGVMTVDMSSDGDLLASGGTCVMCLLLTMAYFRRRGRREGVGSAIEQHLVNSGVPSFDGSHLEAALDYGNRK